MQRASLCAMPAAST
ncbi:hypothetical protein LEMLEM_LOCUS62 [Lemmus lemmus]